MGIYFGNGTGMGIKSEASWDWYRYPNYLITQCGIRGGNSPRQNQLDPTSRFDIIRACHVLGQLSLASLRGRLIEYQLRLG